MKSFEFATATEISFGRGKLAELPARLHAFGSRALVVSGASPSRPARVLEICAREGIETSVFAVSGEPSVELVREGVARGRAFGATFVIGVGGGSVVDAAKAIAVLLTNPGDPLDYVEVIGAGKKLELPGVPCVAIPTTSGTGSEVTKNAVLASAEHRVKVSLRSPYLLPKLALVDSELTHGVPPGVTAATGLDALTQVIEPYVSRASNPLVDAICLEGIRRGARALTRAFRDGSDADAREDMALTSLFGGLALANAKLGAVHGFAAPLGGMFDGPHGAICARLLPLVMAENVRALRARAPEHPALSRYETVAQLLTGEPKATIEEGIRWTEVLVLTLGIPRLSSYGMQSGDIPAVVARARVASSMKGNPIELEERELISILERAL
jgi:alcohol dehydrogenase class IV